MGVLDVPGVREFPEGTHTAEQAAAALGVAVGQIVKSLVFERDGAPLLVLCSGANTVDEAALGVTKARADVVRAATGMSIGGVAPYGHPQPLATVVDPVVLVLGLLALTVACAVAVALVSRAAFSDPRGPGRVGGSG